ncbi:uncharacterized protein LOC114936890 [Nylanderia fulva]|uniref:uncharacterized protein LOC114936890 n=1 Tax=Nylanderia fulva TaxID=613905 RepID=UPI0010FBA8A0|nr:uncharacterized protein LOC114936890 [Nylanderia fulva]XP_029166067.1 uncharacterized protein LOC114936890 [Nylanderia fulva]XP_029166070.1 uncharacterized protein LOC114936890 [Nylanderia fulva]
MDVPANVRNESNESGEHVFAIDIVPGMKGRGQRKRILLSSGKRVAEEESRLRKRRKRGASTFVNSCRGGWGRKGPSKHSGAARQFRRITRACIGGRGDIVPPSYAKRKKKRDSNARHLRARSSSLPAARIFPAHLATENASLQRTVHRAAGDLGNRFFFVTDASPDNQCGALSRHDRSTWPCSISTWPKNNGTEASPELSNARLSISWLPKHLIFYN